MLYLSNGLGVARLVLPFKASLDETTWNTVEVNFLLLNSTWVESQDFAKIVDSPLSFHQ